MMQMLSARWVSSALSVAAQLGIADDLAAGPKRVEDVARGVGAQPGPMRRLLRALASVGVFAEDEQGRFANTPLSETLRAVPGSARGMAMLFGEKSMALAWAELLHSIVTGQTAFEKVHGQPVFEYLDRHEDVARVFNEAMTSRSAMEAAAVTGAFDFSSAERLVDVAGGHGLLLATVLAKNPSQRGVLFDLPKVVAGAAPALERAGVASRCEVVGGNFFEGVPRGADGYILKHILHDWDDESSVRILRNIHAAANSQTRLIVIECVIAPGNAPHFGKLLDLQMLVVAGGRERTRAEWEALLAAGGFSLVRVVDTLGPLSVLEATRRNG
jgi:hypothetical protein